MNTKVNTNDLVNVSIEELRENSQSYENVEAAIELLEKDGSIANNGVVLKALCNSFKINIFLFSEAGNNDIIKCETNQCESPIYLESLLDKSFVSLHWKSGPYDTFVNNVLKLKERLLT